MEPREFYDEIAESWYNIRHWTLFREELEELDERWNGGKLLNLGCAHGADFLPFDEERFEFYGTDISLKLLRNAEKYAKKFEVNFNLFLSDMRKLPLGENKFDYVICVASLHHLLSKEERLDALEEMKKVLKEGGEAFLTVWNKWNPSFLFKNKIMEKSWDFKGRELKRKYYLYTYPELKEDLKNAGFKVLWTKPEKSYSFPLKYFSENILTLARK